MNNTEIINSLHKTLKHISSKYENTITSKDDLYNEGVIAILESIGRWDKKKSSLKHFLRNSILLKIRSVARKNTVAVTRNKDKKCFYSIFENIPHMKNDIEYLDLIDFIHVNDRRGICRKRLIENKTFKQISKETGLSIGTIANHIKKLGEKLKETM